MRHLARRVLVPAAITMVAAAALSAAPALAADEPPCPPEEVADLFLGRSLPFVATHSDGAFETAFHYTPSNANPDPTSFTYAITPAEQFQVEEEPPLTRLIASVPGPHILTASWTQSPKSPRDGPVCRATDTVAFPVFPVLIPPVRPENAGAPVPVGPGLTWPCPDVDRATDAPGTIEIRYERGLRTVPGPGSPKLTLALRSPCDLNLKVDKKVAGVFSASVRTLGLEHLRRALYLFPDRPGDLRVRIAVRWGTAAVFDHEYAVVSAGRRVDPEGDRTPVFFTTEPAAAAAAARRFTRERRGAPYRSPEARQRRRYTLALRGGWITSWAGSFASPGDPGCSFSREVGADRATFSSPSFEPAVGGALRGRIDRRTTETRDCPELFPRDPSACPQRAAMGGSVSAAVLEAGGLTFEGRRVGGPRVAFGLRVKLGGRFCVGWGGLLPGVAFDAAAPGLMRLRVGRSTTVRLARTLDCRDAIVEPRSVPTECAVRVAATARVRRVG